MESVTLAMVMGSLIAIKTAFRCAEILVRAHADNLRERSRRETAMSILTVMQASGDLIAQGKCEPITSARER